MCLPILLIPRDNLGRLERSQVTPVICALQKGRVGRRRGRNCKMAGVGARIYWLTIIWLPLTRLLILTFLRRPTKDKLSGVEED